MNKNVRQIVYEKYGGLCAYTGKPLGDDWQVDHMTPIVHWLWYQKKDPKNMHDIENLCPAITIINHYKRGLTVDGFRVHMMDFHKRLARLPKKTKVAKTEKRIQYMMRVAELFDISVDRPFTGKFYFETLTLPG